MTRARVGVVMGGMSAEREVSLSSGQSVAHALRTLGYPVTEVELVEGGADALRRLSSAPMDVAFLALHGRFGEDGCVQGLLELLGVPYTGSSVLSSALAMDKLKSKELFRLFNVPTPPYYVVDARCSMDELEELHASFGFPVVVKPRREGSSIGLARADDFVALRNAVDHALEFDNSVLVERFVTGREVHVGLLEGRVLGAIEVAPKDGIYDFAAKYTSGLTEYFMPARLPKARCRGVLNLAERAAQALEVVGPARVDLLVTEGQNEYVLEVNTLPGMTPTSLLPKIAESAGYDFVGLCEEILGTARLFTAGAEPLVTGRAKPAVEDLAFEAEEVFVASHVIRSTAHARKVG